jgi:hypothetical protein
VSHDKHTDWSLEPFRLGGTTKFNLNTTRNYENCNSLRENFIGQRVNAGRNTLLRSAYYT